MATPSAGVGRSDRARKRPPRAATGWSDALCGALFLVADGLLWPMPSRREHDPGSTAFAGDCREKPQTAIGSLSMWGRAGHSWRTWLPVAIVFLGVVSSTSAQALWAADPADKRKWWLLGIGLLAAAIAAVTPLVDALVRKRRRATMEERILEARQDEVVAINDALDPLIETLGELIRTQPTQRPSALERMKTQVLNSASQAIGQGRTRVNYFEIDAATKPHRLVCKGHAGRHTKPRTVFRRDREDGLWVFGLLEKNQHWFCPSVTEQPPPGWDKNRTRTYETFLSVPASYGTEAVGMITADAPESGQLREQDAPLLRVFGTILALGVMLAESSEVD